MGTFWSRGHQEGRMSTRDLAYIKWRVESRERDISLGTCNQKAFFLLSFRNMFTYTCNTAFFYCFNKPFHYINWKWKNLLLSYLFFHPWVVTASAVHRNAKCQSGIKSSFVMISQIPLLVSLFLSLKSFPENNGKKTVSDVNICLKAWQKKDYHPSTIGCRWKLESFIFALVFAEKP